MFVKYHKKNNDSKVLLFYLLLNHHDIDKIKVLEETSKDKKRKAVFAITTEAINGKRYEQEIEKIETPTICSPQAYEVYSTSKIIHVYTPEIAGENLWINDLSIISRTMIIEKNCVVTSEIAKMDDKVEWYGFMHFYDYVLKGEMQIANWRVVYTEENCFEIFIKPNEEQAKENILEKDKEFLLFSSVEMDKTATFKFVLYMIRKLQEEIKMTIPSDNFKFDDYEMNFS